MYLTFFRIGAVTFGGGYAMLPILQREVVEKKHWATDEELTDYYAIGQCTPGVIAVNTATFIGQKYRGLLGGIITTLGVVSPSLIIISVIAALINNFSDIAWVQNALGGIRVCVCVFILNSVVKLYKSAVRDKAALAMYVVLFAVAVFFDFSPVWFVLVAGILGVVFTNLGVRGK
ncbi:MAG: chromate transporter [Clostridia bacterium]|nr:chromate transporter [Clostridia bacterium]